MSELRLIVLLIGGVTLWLIWGTMICQSIIVMASLVVVCSLGYGDHTPWPLRMLVFGSLGLPVVWLDHSLGLWWTVVMLVMLSMIEWFSRRYNWVTHKIFEAMAGLLQGAGLIVGVLR